MDVTPDAIVPVFFFFFVEVLPENPQDKGDRYGRENRNPGKNQILSKILIRRHLRKEDWGGVKLQHKTRWCPRKKKKKKGKEHINAAVYLEVFQVPCFLLPPLLSDQSEIKTDW